MANQRLNEEETLAIHQDILEGTLSAKEIAEKHKISKPYVYHLIQKYSGKHYTSVRFGMLKHKAKSKNIPFTILESDLSYPEYCPVLGIKLNYSAKNISDNSPSIDKIIPELGYIKGNVKIISNRANRIKNDGSYEEHLAVAEYIKSNTSN